METVFDPFADGGDIPDPRLVTPEPTPCYSTDDVQPDGVVSSYSNPGRPTAAWSDESGHSVRCLVDGHPADDTLAGHHEDDESDDDDAIDPASRLLGKDFTQLLKSVVQAAGRNKHPGVMVTFDGLDLRPPVDGVRG
eukprot:EG_transcript_42520